MGGNAFGTTGVAIGATEFIGVGVAVLVLVLTFGSLLAAGMNLLTATVGIGVGMGACCSPRTWSRSPRARRRSR